MSKLFKDLRSSRHKYRSTTSDTQQAETVSIPPSPSPPSGQSKESIGLFELSNNDNEKSVDVVAVHGLQGDAYETWKHDNGFIWLKDFLPAQVPSARIMTFGYDSTVAFSKSVAKLDDKALDLLNRLGGKRSVPTKGCSRPIVFICHSLGGILVKKALILAHERSSDPEYRDILENTNAIAFIGVPHKGSDSAWWATFAANALKGASLGTSTNTALVADLKKDSSTLTSVSKQFVDRTAQLQIYTFYETQKLYGVVVVDELSARIGIHEEKLFPIDADHKTICKISSAESQHNEALCLPVAKLIRQANERKKLVAEKSSSKSQPSYYEVPNRRRVRQLFGREDILERVHEALSSGPGLQICVLQGMGGQGKSQVALEYCYRRKDDPYTATFWVDATSERAMKGSFETIAECTKSEAILLSNTDARVAFVMQRLSSWPTSWLMVFDNYDDPVAFPNIRDFIPDCKTGAVLVTSRHRDSRELAIDQNKGFLELPGLSEEAALGLLVQESWSKNSDPISGIKIVRRLGYHPLAIVQAGAYIKKRELQFCDFEDRYVHQRKIILENTPPLSQYRKKLGDSEKEVSLNVFTTWELSFQELVSQTSDESYESRLLALFAFYDNKDISERIFAAFNVKALSPGTLGFFQWLNNPTPDPGWDKYKFEGALVMLKDLSLLQVCAREEDGFHHFSLHPLIKDWIRLRTGVPASQNNTVIATTMLGKISIGPELPLVTKQNLVLHIMTQEQNYQDFFASQCNISLSQETMSSYMVSLTLLAGFLCEMGLYNPATVIFDRGVKCFEEAFGRENSFVLTIKDKLASTHWSRGLWKEAQELNVQVMELRKSVLGVEHPDTLLSMSNLALTFELQGKLKEAEELCVQVLEVRKRVLGAEHPKTLISMNNLAATYEHQGKLKEAEELGVQVVEARKRVRGAEHPETLTSKNILSSIFFRQGKLTEAEELDVHVLEARKRVLGAEHRDTLVSMGALASTYEHQGRWDEAEMLGRRALEIRKRVLGAEDLDTLLSMNNLASAFWCRGKIKEAEELHVQVLEMRKRIIGAEHPDTLISMSNLATIFWRQERLKEAEELETQVIETEKKVLGAEHPSTLNSIHNLACIFFKDGQKSKAIQLMTNVVKSRKEKLGEQHPDSVLSMGCLEEWTKSEA